MILNRFLEILSSSVLITGLVVVMMMLIECFNVWSKGRFASAVSRKGPLQVVIAAFLGAVPGCMGGFAVVSMYTHGMLSFGALIAMMIASSGDESFVMLAMIPRTAWLLFLALTLLAIVVGLVIDFLHKGNNVALAACEENYAVHEHEALSGTRHFGWQRIAILLGVGAFLAALCFGFFEEEGHAEAEYMLGGINLLSEDWMNVMFAVFGLLVLVLAVTASDHFVQEHLWHHVICHHLLKIFLWTFGALAVIAALMHFVDISQWMSDNVILMILIASAVGVIPESGPHMVFVTMFASGIVPLPVLVASCISQDGHSALPLLAENRKAFLQAKAVNFIIAVVAGLGMHALNQLM